VSSFYSIGTLGIYENSLRHFLVAVGDQQLSSISAQHIDIFRQQRLREVSPTTLNLNLRSLRSAFSYAVRWQLLSNNPFTRVPLCKVPERSPLFFSAEDFKRLVSGIKEKWLKSIVILAACTGMRRGEVVNLKWRDVDLAQKELRIESSGGYRTKCGKRRAIPLNIVALQLLEELSKDRLSEYVVTVEGRRVREPYLSRRFKQYIHRLGFDPSFHFHNLRHSFASWLVQNGAPIYEIQKLMGHSTIRVTEIYAHLAPNQLHGTVERLSEQLTMN
jgi:integrase